MVNKQGVVAYLLFVHLALIATITIGGAATKFSAHFTRQSYETSMYTAMLPVHERLTKSMASGSTLFVGNSIIQGMNVQAITPRAVNFGIGRDTTAGVLARISGINKALLLSEGLILAIGINDLTRGKSPEYVAEQIANIIESLVFDREIFVSLILPVGEDAPATLNSRITETNNLIRRALNSHPRVTMIDTGVQLKNPSGFLKHNFHSGDGIHLSRVGYAQFMSSLKSEFDLRNSEVLAKTTSTL